MNNSKQNTYLSKNLGAIVGLILSIALIGTSIYFTVITSQGNLPIETSIQYILLLLTILFSTLLLERVVFFSINKDKNNIVINQLEKITTNLHQENNSNDSTIFYEEQENFISFCEDANEIFMVGLTKVGSIAETAEFIINKVKSGTKIQALVVDYREKKLIEYIARATNHSFDRLKIDTLQSKETIKTILNSLTPTERKLFEVRAYKSIPSVGFIYKKTLKKEEMQVYFYIYKTDPSARISLKLTSEHNSLKINYFLKHYRLMWDDSQPIVL